MHVCPNCGAEFEGNFCPNCGAKWEQEKTCPECGAKLAGAARFCTRCGYSFSEQTRQLEKTAPPAPAPAKNKQKPSAALAWVKGHLKIVVPVALLLVTLIVLLSLIPTFIAMKTNGTYYGYNNGEYNGKIYITLNFGAWTDNEGLGGSYKIEDDKITLNVDFMGEDVVFATGVVSNGVLKIENLGTFCRKGHSHSGEWDVTKAATCTEDGLETRICLCGFKETREVKCVGHHDFGGWVTTEEPTCTKDGKQTGKCSRCEATDTKPIRALGHDFKSDVCTRCNESAFEFKLSSDGSYYTLTKYYKNNLTTVVIPSQKDNIPVTTIGYEAFYSCSGLTSITIPNSVTKIGYGAFSYCRGLTDIYIPNGVTEIGEGAFAVCSELQTISVASGNEKYHSAGNCLIETESKILIAGCKNSIIPNDGSVTTIGYGAFHSCSGLTSITIPDGVTEIGRSAFYECSGLTSITIPDGVTTIGYEAFSYCTSLTSITIPDGVTVIGSRAFYSCSGLTNITIPDGVTEIGEEAFYECSGLTSITIPDSVTTIGDGVFYGCSGLTSITIPDSVTTIGNRAFHSCSGLTSITIPDGVTTIGYEAFSYCTSLTSITIPDGVTEIGVWAFSCSRLTDINFKGTMGQWQAIEKDSMWNDDTGNYTVHCTDGDILKADDN